MTLEQKQAIATEVTRLSKLYGKKVKGKEETSGTKVAIKAGVSTSYISQIINGKFDVIADETWRKLKIKLRVEFNWKTAETENFNKITGFLDMVKTKGKSIGFSFAAGAGKSHAYQTFERNNKNVIYVECKTYWKQKGYVKALLTACGLSNEGTTDELIEKFENHLIGLDKPIVIIDQIDKLKDASLDLFIDFYNDFDGHCGFVLSGVPAFEKRMLRGVKNIKTGYFEVWSRIGKTFIPLKPVQLEDVKAICNANGLEDKERIQIIFNTCEGDLRRVKRDVEKYFLIQKERAA
jgi:DNA transposition AAA+ family ATPase